MSGQEYECYACGSPVPFGAGQCPACGEGVAFCRKAECTLTFPPDVSFCPSCGDAVEGPSRDALSKPAAADPQPAAAGPSEGLSQGAGQSKVFDQMLSLFSGDSATAAAPPRKTTPQLPQSPQSTGKYEEMLTLFQAGDAPQSTSEASAAANRLPVQSAGRPVVQPGAGPGTMPTMPPMPAMPSIPGGFAGPLTIPTLGVGGGPVCVEVEASGKYRKNQQSLLRVRVRGEHLSSESVVELNVGSELLSAPGAFQTRLISGQMQEFQALRFVPKWAGADSLRFVLTVKTPANLPLGRWTASWVINIEDEEKKEIHAGGDVFIVGGAPPMSGPQGFDLGLGGLGSAGGWQPLELQPDHAFIRRLAGACPEPAGWNVPASASEHGWPAGARAQAAVWVYDQHTGLRHAISAVCGASASLGRGGDPAVAWWLRPSPYDAHQHGRLSRCHASLELRDDRAWAADRSTNGTWVNGERLPRAAPCLLADDDRLEPAQVVPFQVRLQACDGHVHTLWLYRNDTLAEQLSYLLTDGRFPVAFVPPGNQAPVLWLAWQRDPQRGPELLACSSDGAWQILAPQQACVLGGRHRIVWQILPTPVDDAQYLAPNMTSTPAAS